jgi:dTDP-4-dehydrorhamnose 3,5-epimerase
MMSNMNNDQKGPSKIVSDYHEKPVLFVDGPIQGVVVRPVSPHTDGRGWLAEIFRHDELPQEFHPVMAYVSETLPGVQRGPHEHATQTDYFAFLGPGDFVLYLWDMREASPTRGNRLKMSVGQSNRQIVIVPPGVVHAYKNRGVVAGWVFNAPNRLYGGEGRHEAVDEIRHEDVPDIPFLLD